MKTLSNFSYQFKEASLHAKPIVTEIEIEINASINSVWKIFSEINNWSQWQYEITKSKLIGTLKAGSNFNWKNRGVAVRSTIHTFEPYREISWSAPASGSFAMYTWQFKVIENQTIVNVSQSVEGWLVNLFREKFQLISQTSLSHWLESLKTAVETIKLPEHTTKH